MDKVITIKHLSPRFRSKIAAFDLDHTLIKPKGGLTFPKDENDFTFYTFSTTS